MFLHKQYRYNRRALLCSILFGMLCSSAMDRWESPILYPSYQIKSCKIHIQNRNIIKIKSTKILIENDGWSSNQYMDTKLNRLSYITSTIDVSIVGLFSNRSIDLLSTVQLLLLEGMENSTVRPLKKNPWIKFLRYYAHTCLFVSST